MAGYRRTISFPAPKPATDAFFALSAASDKLAAYRVRSASLPCRFHPLLLQLDDDVAALRLVTGQSPPPCAASASSTPTASSVSAAASQVGRVLVSLSDLLAHPQAQDPLRRLARSPLADRLLDDFLRLADAHGSFRQALVALASCQAETHAALRRGHRGGGGGDPARLASASRAQRRAGRDLPRLAAAARAVAGKPPAPLPEGLPADAAALAAAVADATAAVASGSAAVFSGLASLSNAAASARVEVASTPCWATAAAAGSSSSDGTRAGHHRIWWVADLVRWMSRAKRRSAEKHSGAGADEDESSTVQLRSETRMKPEERARRAALERHENLERCIASVDASGERVFRALVNTRVSLLNILSPSF
ncbi:unnamed protein product [Urochloa decumbens]|uniref:Uncharacterized protein n=1 Tax=Urochloa decumbens TaxID=240449 RepID=A0ABC9F4A2_9POAL